MIDVYKVKERSTNISGFDVAKILLVQFWLPFCDHLNTLDWFLLSFVLIKAVTTKLHIQIPPDRLRGSHITQYCCGYFKSQYR